eukprot:10883357-Ditylum_brightwellii.AAC.3
MRTKVDADHAGDTINRQSRTGFIIYLNSAPVYWMPKKQTSIDTSLLGSEFIAMKQCCEQICGLQYKLRMMGIPDCTLKKKIQSIAYHFVREGSARDEW